MASDTRRMVFEFIAIDRVSKSMRSIGDNAGKMSSKFSAVGAAVKGGVAGAAVGGIAILGKAMLQGVKDAASYQTLLNKTAAVIKSTGGSANVSVKHVAKLASSLESLSGVDEELIINSENVLQTFTRIRNTKTQDTFDQATKAALNLSTAMGTDLKSSTVLVGKALNDPIRGMTALRRVGVSFTKSQQDTIKKLEETGHHEKAQALILKELNKEFGGAAKAAGQGFAGSLARAKDAVSDAFRAVGQKLLPVLTRLADWFASKGFPQLVKFAQTMKTRLEPTFKTVSQWASDHLVPALKTLGQWISSKLLPVLGKFATTYLKGIVDGFKRVAGAFKDNEAHYKGFLIAAGKVAAFLLKVLGPTLGWLAKTVFGLVSRVMSAEIRIIGTLLGWLGKLGAGAVKVGKFFGDIAKKMSSAWTGFKNKVKEGTLTIVKMFLSMVSTLVTGAAKAFGWVPGVGPKLRRASDAVKKWKDQVNAELRKLKSPKTINLNVDAKGRWQLAGGGMGRTKPFLAKGGPVPAMWPGASEHYDSQPAVLRVNEHVWTPEEVKAAGGHGAVVRLRKAALRGEVKGYADGGPVWNFGTKLPGKAERKSKMWAPIIAGTNAMVATLAKAMAAIYKKFMSGGSIVAAARRMIGVPYSWGGGGKGGPSFGIGRGAHTKGFDCSGLTQYAWWQGRHHDIGGTTGPQAAGSSRSARRPGALGFIGNPIHHVMLDSGGGYVIQAPFTGSHVQEVKRSSPNWRWPRGFYSGGPAGQLGARAIANPATRKLAMYANMLGISGNPQRRAGGGPVRSGMPYLVGEYGPEIVTPRHPGDVHPAGSVIQHITLNIKATPLTDTHQLGKDITETLTRYQRRGGKLSFQS